MVTTQLQMQNQNIQAQGYIQQQRQQIESARKQAQEFQPRVQQTQRQLRSATIQSQAGIKAYEAPRIQAQQQALAEIGSAQAQFESEVARIEPGEALPQYLEPVYQEAISAVTPKVESLRAEVQQFKEAAKRSTDAERRDYFEERAAEVEARLAPYENLLTAPKAEAVKQYFSGEAAARSQYEGNVMGMSALQSTPVQGQVQFSESLMQDLLKQASEGSMVKDVPVKLPSGETIYKSQRDVAIDLLSSRKVAGAEEAVGAYNIKMGEISKAIPVEKWVDVSTQKVVEVPYGGTFIAGKTPLQNLERVWVDPRTNEPIQNLQKYYEENKIPFTTTQTGEQIKVGKLETAKEMAAAIDWVAGTTDIEGLGGQTEKFRALQTLYPMAGKERKTVSFEELQAKKEQFKTGAGFVFYPAIKAYELQRKATGTAYDFFKGIDLSKGKAPVIETGLNIPTFKGYGESNRQKFETGVKNLLGLRFTGKSQEIKLPFEIPKQPTFTPNLERRKAFETAVKTGAGFVFYPAIKAYELQRKATGTAYDFFKGIDLSKGKAPPVIIPPEITKAISYKPTGTTEWGKKYGPATREAIGKVFTKEGAKEIGRSLLEMGKGTWSGFSKEVNVGADILASVYTVPAYAIRKAGGTAEYTRYEYEPGKYTNYFYTNPKYTSDYFKMYEVNVEPTLLAGAKYIPTETGKEVYKKVLEFVPKSATDVAMLYGGLKAFKYVSTIPTLAKLTTASLTGFGGYSGYKAFTATTPQERAGYIVSAGLSLAPVAYGGFKFGKTKFYDKNPTFLTKKGITEYEELTYLLGSKTKALRSIGSEAVGNIFSITPKQTGVITTKSGKLFNIRTGETVQAGEDLLVSLRSSKKPNIFTSRGGKTYVTPLEVSYKRGIYVPGKGYQVQEIKIPDKILQRIDLGKNIFETQGLGKAYSTIGKGLRKVTSEMNIYRPSGKYSIVPVKTKSRLEQFFAVTGTSTVGEEKAFVISTLKNLKNIKKMPPTQIESELSKTFEVGFTGKKGRGIATAFDKPQMVFTGLGEAKFSGIRKATLTMPSGKEQGTIKILQLVPGKKPVGGGAGKSYITKVDVKTGKGILEGKEQEVLTYLTYGKEAGLVYPKSGKGVLVTSKTLDIYRTKLPNLGGGGGGRGGIPGGDEGFGGGGGVSFDSGFGINRFGDFNKKMAPTMFEQEMIMSGNEAALQSLSPVSFKISAPQYISPPTTKSFGAIGTTGTVIGGIKAGTQIKSPVMTQIKSPVMIMTKAPSMIQIKSPVMTQIKSPVMTMIKSPVMTMIKAPVLTQVKVPVRAMVKTQVMTQIKSPVMTQARASTMARTAQPIRPIIPKPVPPIRYRFMWPRPRRTAPLARKSPKEEIGYTFQVRRRKKYEAPLAISVSKEAAFALGARAVTIGSKSSAATFKIVPTGRRAAPVAIKPTAVQKALFRPGRKAGEFVQKSRLRIITPSEVQQISYKGALARKRGGRLF